MEPLNKENLQDSSSVDIDQPVNNAHQNILVPKKSNRRKIILLSVGGLFIAASIVVGARLVTGNWLVAYADTSAKANIVTGFRKLGKQRPSVISGNVKLVYKDSYISTTADLDYTNTFDSITGNPGGSGQLRINGNIYPYQFVNIHKDTYFKLDNIAKLDKVVSPTNPIYGYVSSHKDVLNKYSGKWLVSKGSNNSSGNSATSGKYSCVLSSYPYFDSSDATGLQTAMTVAFPFKVQKSASITINKEKLTKIDLVAESPSVVNKFTDKINNLNTVKKLNACSQEIAHTPLLPKVSDAYKNNSVKVSIYLTKDKVIRRIDISTSGIKSTTSLTATFDYTKQIKQLAPTGAKSADLFINALTQ